MFPLLNTRVNGARNVLHRAELDHLSTKLEPLKKQSGLLWKLTILEFSTTHTPQQCAYGTHT